MLNLKEFRQTARGLPDLLPYAALVAPGIVLCKDGSLLAGWEYRGRDVASSMPDELEFLSQKVNDALMQLGSGWMLHVDAIRKPEAVYQPQGAFPDALSLAIDEERRAFFSQRHCLCTVTTLCVTYKPDFGGDALSRMAGAELSTLSALEKAIDVFQTSLDALEDGLSSVLAMQRLTDYDDDDTHFSSLLSHLQHLVTGVEQPMRVPVTPMYLDAVIGGAELVGGLSPRLDGQWMGALSLDGLPQESWPAMLDVLGAMPFPCRFSSRFICLDQLEALKAIDVYRRSWSQKVVRFLDTFLNTANPHVNRDAARMVEDAEQAKDVVQSGEVGAGYITSSIILLDRDQNQLLEHCRDMRKILQSLGFGCRMEQINALETWLGSLPGNSVANVRRPIVNTMNVADLLPLTASWSGLELNPNPLYPAHSPALIRCLTDGSTPFWLTPSFSDLGHTLIVGPPGSGKSTLLGLMTVQFFRYERAQVFAFDKGRSMFALCSGMGGKFYDVGKDLALAPLRYADQPEERAWAVDWLVGLARAQGLDVQPTHKNAIQTAVSSLASRPQSLRTMTDFWELLQDPDGNLKPALRSYTRAGGLEMLDAQEDGFGFSSFMVFELEDLMNRDAAVVVPVLLYLFHRLEAAMTGRPSVLVLDEAWIMLDHEMFKAKIKEWLKVLRKKVCSVWMATQSLSDAANSGIWDAIVQSCLCRILLANHAANQPGVKEHYKNIGFNAVELDLLARATPKRDYYFTHPAGKRMIQLALGKLALAFVGVSDPQSVARVQELMTELPDGWREAWVMERVGLEVDLRVKKQEVVCVS